MTPPSPFGAADEYIRQLERRVADLEDAVRVGSTPATALPRTAYRPSEVAAMCGVTAQTVRDWIDAGRITAVNITADGHRATWAITAEALDAFLNGRAVAS